MILDPAVAGALLAGIIVTGALIRLASLLRNPWIAVAAGATLTAAFNYAQP